MKSKPQIFTSTHRQRQPLDREAQIELKTVPDVLERACRAKITRQISLAGNLLNVEVADSPASLAQGLMNRKAMGCDGMLFVMRGEPASFHMKNTYMPLDIVFFNEVGEAVKIDQMKPLVGRSSCDDRVFYILELPAGVCKKMDVRIGDRLTLDAQQQTKAVLRQFVIESLKQKI